MSLRQLSLVIDTDRNTCRDFAGNTVNATVVNGDTILLAAHAKRLNYSTGVLEDLVLTGAKALRVTVRATRDPAADLLTFQDVYNSGDLPSFEDLAKGQVTWQINFNSANLDALFAATDSVSVWLEITYLDAADLPQTIYQGRLTVNQQLDDGAIGTPPPASPTYLTAAEIAADYQPLDAELTALAGLTSAADKLPYFTGAGTADVADFTASARTLTALAAARGDLLYASDADTWAALTIGDAGEILLSDGTDLGWADLATAGIQPADAELTALAGLTSEADKLPYFTGDGTADLADFTASARTFTALAAVLGDLLYASGADTWAALAGNTTTTKMYLSQTGDGDVSAAPVWAQPAFADLSDVPAYSANGSKFLRINAAEDAVEAVTQQSHIADPSGGTTVDSEARTAIGYILTALETLTLLASS